MLLLNRLKVPEGLKFVDLMSNLSITFIDNEHRLYKPKLQTENHFKIIALAETRKINDKIINTIKNNNSYEYVNPKLNRCGGILLIINKKVDYSVSKEYNLDDKTVDDIWLEYKICNKNTLIAFI